jgi:phosphoglycolate phosphatase
MSSPIRAILFDKDGTILDYFRTWVPINREVTLFAAGGDQTLADQLLRLGGQDPVGDDLAPNSLLASAGVAEIAETFAAHLGDRTPPKLYDNIAQIFRDGGARTSVLIDGALDAVLELKRRGYKLGIATNDTADGMHASLARFNVVEHFDFLSGCDSGFGAKPLPGMALAFAALISVPPSAIAVVGDSTHDLEMGRAAGCGLNIAVLSGTGTRDDLEPHADLVLATISDMLPLVQFAGPRATRS